MGAGLLLWTIRQPSLGLHFLLLRPAAPVAFGKLIPGERSSGQAMPPTLPSSDFQRYPPHVYEYIAHLKAWTYQRNLRCKKNILNERQNMASPIAQGDMQGEKDRFFFSPLQNTG